MWRLPKNPSDPPVVYPSVSDPHSVAPLTDLSTLLHEEGMDGAFLRLSQASGKIYLRSDLNHPWGKENILVWSPYLTIRYWAPVTEIRYGEQITNLPGNSFIEMIPAVLLQMHEQLNITADYAIISRYVGFYGYLAYEAGRSLENYPLRSDCEKIPRGLYRFPLVYLVEHPEEWLYIEIYSPDANQPGDDSIPCFLFNLPRVTQISSGHAPIPAECSQSYSEYLASVEAVKHHIKTGDIYQANYTVRFTLPGYTDALDRKFVDVFNTHPTPYAAFLQDDNFTILSFSPELFLQIHDGTVLTRPIKGTRARGVTPAEDARLATELTMSVKDHAELSMIVDLLRNDLSRSCCLPSVRVLDHAKLESFSNVHHLITTIEGHIDQSPGNSWRLLLRAFPGGSITGCPKLRSMEILEALESVPRGVYTGSIGMITLNGELRQNIAIRTVTAFDDRIEMHAGGGIVYDSVPAEEYLEVLHKVRHLMPSFGGTIVGHLVWENGHLIPPSTASAVEIPSKGPPGCFETILVEDGCPMYLSDHLTRLSRGLQHLGLNVPIPSEQSIREFIQINCADTARLKLQVIPPFRIRMEIHPYSRDNSPVRLLIYPKTFEIPPEVRQWGIKTNNYTLYHDCTAIAQGFGFWDSILVTPEGLLLEGGRCNLYYLLNGCWYTPPASVVQGTVRNRLLTAGLVNPRELRFKDFSCITAIFISNALNGVRPVREIHRILSISEIPCRTKCLWLNPTPERDILGI
jgi:anthranilate/para-aminobenzoate synthase component I